jgi:GNAT superfamily N-acetyltransferase
VIGLHLENAAAMWASRAPGAVRGDGYALAEHPGGARVIVLDPAARAGDVLALAPRRKLLVEDAFGILPTAGATLMPIMVRRPGPLVAPPASVRVSEVHTQEELTSVERVIVDGFPLPGQSLDPALLGRPGWRFWLGRCDGAPAAAAYTFDDGTAVGVYWLATLPEHRSRGAGRAVLATAVAAAPGRHVTLIATEAGRPLYESAGFQTAGRSAWHTREPVTR